MFTDTCGFATTFTQIEESRSSDPASCYTLDFLYSRVVQGKSFFNANTVGYFANGIRGVHFTTLSFDNDTLKHLDTFLAALDDVDTIVLVGSVDGYPFGFLLARVEETLIQSGGQRIGSIRLIFVEQDAREVAVAEAMREEALALLRERGITKFDAHVLPGHRLAKNFFESGGFSARSIVMFHDDER